MASEIVLRTYDAAGGLTHVITDYLQVGYSRRVMRPGRCVFVLGMGHGAIADLVLGAAVEVWRRDAALGLEWRCEFAGLWRGETRADDENGVSTYTGVAVDGIGLLELATVGYAAGKSGRNTWAATKAETIAKALVTYNLTSSGTVLDGRQSAVTAPGISVAADGAGGNTISFSCAWARLLDALQEVARVGGGDWDMVKTGAGTWEFRWFNGQLGTDRSSSVVFATNFGNMKRPRLVRDHVSERTVAIVGGMGEEAARAVVVRTGANYDADVNWGETFVDARNAETTGALQVAGDARLVELQASEQLSFEVVQTPGSAFGVHYDVGDLVTGRYWDVVATKQIVGVSVEFAAQGGERLEIELESV